MSEMDTEIVPDKTSTTAETLTEYVVLRLFGTTAPMPTWIVEGTFRGRSGVEAVRDLLDGHDDPAGTYVAVPARSWKPLSVKAEQTVTLKLEQAT